MEAFITNALTFPTLIYSIGFCVVICFWLLSMFGLFGIDAFDVDVEVDVSGIGSVAGLLTTVGLTGVPITIVISLLVLNGWLLCYLGSMLVPEFPSLLGVFQLLINIIILVVSFIVSMFVTAQMIRPLRSLFRTINKGPISSSIIGVTCRIRSSRADHAFGEAECTLDGASLIIKVRTSGEEVFKTGDLVVIISHQVASNTFQVVSEQAFSQQLNG